MSNSNNESLIFTKESIIRCLTARISGIHIKEANEYIMKLEVIIIIYNFLFLFSNLAKYFKYQTLSRIITRTRRDKSCTRSCNNNHIWFIKRTFNVYNKP